jgi:hypothetical protein
MEQTTICLVEVDFFNDWDQWKNTINRPNTMKQKIGMSEVSSTRVSTFFTDKLGAKSKEEFLLRDLWSVATPKERKTLGELIFRVIDKTANEYGNQELNEPYGGY